MKQAGAQRARIIDGWQPALGTISPPWDVSRLRAGFWGAGSEKRLNRLRNNQIACRYHNSGPAEHFFDYNPRPKSPNPPLNRPNPKV
jgi:hypothetical protein